MKEHSFHIHSDFTVEYPDHEQPRKEQGESPVFRATKKHWHSIGAKCLVNNKDCKGNVEIHHRFVEWAAQEAADWEKLRKDHPGFDWSKFKNPEDFVDSIYNTEPLCALHHRGPAPYGKHNTPDPIWYMQLYVLQEFEYTKENNNNGS